MTFSPTNDAAGGEPAVGDKRTALERGRYLARTTDMDRNVGIAVAWKELGYTDTAIARKMGTAPGTATQRIDRAVAQYGLSAGWAKLPADRDDFQEVTREDIAGLDPAVRGEYRAVAVEHPGVVPDGVLDALNGDNTGGGR